MAAYSCTLKSVSTLLLLSILFIKTWTEGSIEFPLRGKDSHGKVNGLKAAGSKPPWGYDNGGPDEWSKHHNACAGYFQSPIAFWQDDVVVDEKLPLFELMGYEKDLGGVEMTNNGHTVQLDLKPAMYGLQISGGGLPSGTKYRLEQLHCHWGANDEIGSEHMIGDQYYPLEMHLVHIKEPLTLGQALLDPQGIAVLGVFFEHNDADNNTALSPLMDVMDSVQHKGSKTSLRHPIKIRDLLPLDISNFYRYQGSLTTPPCSESVTWTVFVHSHPITTEQLNKLRSLSTSSDATLEPELQGKLLFNHRPVQPLFDRKVLIRKQLIYPLPLNPTPSIATMIISNAFIIFPITLSVLSLIR